MEKRRTMVIALTGLLALFTMLPAQNAPVDFETGGFGADWTWTVFENDSNPAVEIISNPASGGINTSATVAKFTALQTGQPWAGCETQHGADIGEFTLTEENCVIKIMVYKSVISDVGIKLVSTTDWSAGEIKVANTLINEWEELSFDFSGQMSPGEGVYDQIVVFPDFDLNYRTADNIVYFDNISFNAGSGGTSDVPETAAPTPGYAADDVISLFSNAYTNVTVDTWSADWDQADMADVQIAGNDVKRYTNLNYAGIEFTSATINAAEMNYFHIDIWTPDQLAADKVFKVKLVDFGADGAWSGGDDVEHELAFDNLTTGQWISLHIPLSDFTALTTKEHLAQLIISGDPNTVYVDNVFFSKTVTAIENLDEMPAAFQLQQNFPNPFNPSTSISYTIAQPAFVQLNIFNANGQLVEALPQGFQSMNTYNIIWNATEMASGVYYYSLMIDGKQTSAKRMILVK
jgi:hypothetical protein